MAAHNDPTFPVPREHGAIAMLLTPFAAAAFLSRQWRWLEIAALLAAWCTFSAKDPLITLARQRFVWKQRKPEARSAARRLILLGSVLSICGLALVCFLPLLDVALLGLGAAGFSALATYVSLRNRQRAAWFQIASAAALTSSSVAANLAATGAVPEWCWALWLLCAAQAAAGILVVHARLEARIAARKGSRTDSRYRREAFAGVAALGVAAIAAAAAGREWIAAALLIAAAGYAFELRRQRSARALQTPLTHIGLQVLTLSVIYTGLVVRGLW